MSAYLQKHISCLRIADLFFFIQNSEAVVETLITNIFSNRSIYNKNVQDLFYTRAHDPLLSLVRAYTDPEDELSFRNSSGVSTDSFVEPMPFYLDTTIVGWSYGLFLQRSEACIGPCVAPVLSDIFLARTGRGYCFSY